MKESNAAQERSSQTASNKNPDPEFETTGETMAFGKAWCVWSASLPKASPNGTKYVSGAPFSYLTSTMARTAFESGNTIQSEILVDRMRRAVRSSATLPPSPPNHLCFDKYCGNSTDSNRYRPAPSSRRSQVSATRGVESS